jgi:hypothetical protein
MGPVRIARREGGVYHDRFLSETKASDPQPKRGSKAPARRVPRAGFLISIAAVVAGASFALAVALSDEGGEAHPASGPEVATGPSSAATEPAPTVPGDAAPQPSPAALAGPEGGVASQISAIDGATVSRAADLSGAAGRARKGEGGGRSSSASGSATSAHVAASAAHKPDAGAVAEAPPDGGVRPVERKLALTEGTRRASKADGDDRDSVDELVLVARFVLTGGAKLEGRVVDADSGRPVAGVSVEARHESRYMKGSTDGNGAFRMAGLQPGSRVVVWIGGKRDPYIAERIDVAIPGEGQKAETGVVRLLRGDEMGPRLDGWVGLFVTRRSGRVMVSAVTPWLPADRAGVKVGDVMVSINGRDIAGFGPRAATYLLRGPPATPVSFVVEDHSAVRQRLTLERVAR